MQRTLFKLYYTLLEVLNVVSSPSEEAINRIPFEVHFPKLNTASLKYEKLGLDLKENVHIKVKNVLLMS